jgi:hypothetical protein
MIVLRTKRVGGWYVNIYICYIYICYICICYIYICYIYVCYIYICYIYVCYIYICYIYICYIYICYSYICYIYICVRGGAVGGSSAIQAGRLRVRFPMTSFWPHYGHGGNSASNTNEYQE